MRLFLKSLNLHSEGLPLQISRKKNWKSSSLLLMHNFLVLTTTRSLYSNCLSRCTHDDYHCSVSLNRAMENHAPVLVCQARTETSQQRLSITLTKLSNSDIPIPAGLLPRRQHSTQDFRVCFPSSYIGGFRSCLPPPLFGRIYSED